MYLPALIAARVPTTIDVKSQMMPAPSASDSVAGIPALISVSTLKPSEYEYAWPLKMFSIVLTYWTKIGLLKPYLTSSRWISSGVARCPARRFAGLPFGIAAKSRKVSSEIAIITAIIANSRRTMKRPISGWPVRGSRAHFALDPQRPKRTFARGSSASRSPSPKTLIDSTASTSMMPGTSTSLKLT